MNKKYQAALKKLNNTADGAGLGLDEKIKHAVAAFNAAGFVTTASCQGHLDHGYPYPWIDFGVETANADMEQPPPFLESFINDLDKFVAGHNVGSSFGVFANVNKGQRQYMIVSDSEKFRRLYSHKIGKQTKSKIEQLNIKSSKKMYSHLEKFYADRTVPYPHMLTLAFYGDYAFRLQSNVAGVMPGLTAKEQIALRKECLKQINNLADFVLTRPPLN